ncbi:MAG TPA: type I-E CRISPR-associated protein Cas5/CasD, partial [Myxococcota bacterium]|nr:type I-E CRISPR-associated protein Cas5/CasD [Myxococcota bacterium]
TVVLGLRDGEGPTLDDIHDALVRPARPLFLGRKPCLPSRPLVPAGAQAWVEAATVGEAIRAASGPSRVDRPRSRRVWYPADADGRHTLVRRDLRNWRSDTHEGSRLEAMEVWDE